MVTSALMQAEQLIHHTKEGGYASYGRDGGPGRDIMIAPSTDIQKGRKFVEQIYDHETSVVALLDDGPSAHVQAALETLMPVWNTAQRGNVYIAHNAQNIHVLQDGFMDAVRKAYGRERLPIDGTQEAAMEVICRDICESAQLAQDAMNNDSEAKLRLMYYPPSSKPISIFHNWHADIFPETIIGQMRMQRSLNVQGLSFAFKDQADPTIKAGVGLSTGHALFKITPENVHKGAPISPTVGRAIYTITAEPAREFFWH